MAGREGRHPAQRDFGLSPQDDQPPKLTDPGARPDPEDELSFLEIIAELANKYPHGEWTREKVGKLDPWWVANILLPPRIQPTSQEQRSDNDKKIGRIAGLPEKKKNVATKSQRDHFFERFRKKDYPDWKIAEKWAVIEAATVASTKANEAANPGLMIKPIKVKPLPGKNPWTGLEWVEPVAPGA